MISNFLNQIIFNLKNSKNFFLLNNEIKFFYSHAYIKLLKLNYVLSKENKSKIALFSDKSIGYYVSVIGIFLSGNTWIQISPNIPLQKIKEIIKFSNIQIGLYDESFNNKKVLRIKNIKILKLSKIFNSIKKKDLTFKEISKKDIACIFFTSGSSGEPKGVKITYENLISCAFHQIRNLNYKNNQIFADCHDTSFVMSLVVIFPTVYLNGTFSPLISLSDKLNPMEYFIDNKINNLITVPSFILFNKNKISKLRLKNLILCGESFPYKILDILLKKTKVDNIYNCYGATELSPWAFYYEFKKKDLNIIKKFGKVPIGKPFKNIKYNFNKNNELIISGNIVSNGYLKNKSETQKRFSIKNKTINYNTGDIGFKYKNLIFISGRNDSQIKIRGYRVDLNEIENVARKYKKTLFSFCFFKKNKIFLIYNNENGDQKKKILFHLQKFLPNYMLPNKIRHIKEIPFNKNGKVDRVRLKKIND